MSYNKEGRKWADLRIGHHDRTPLLNGSRGTYIKLDNASSTPSLNRVFEKTQEFLRVYVNVGREENS